MTNTRLKIWFGFMLGAVLGGLSYTTSLGKVDETHSYGFKDIIDVIKFVFAQWAGWAFFNTFIKDKEEPSEPAKDEKTPPDDKGTSL